MGDEEIKLVRKKLKWPHLPFEIPKEILNEWREIGSKGDTLEKNWLNGLNNSKKEIKDNFNLFNNTIFRDRLNNLVVQIIQKPQIQ